MLKNWDIRAGVGFFSITKSQALKVLEGDPYELGVRILTLINCGDFKTIEIEELMMNDEIIVVVGRAKSLTGDYNQPNRDEIERMLLERRKWTMRLSFCGTDQQKLPVELKATRLR